MISARILLSNLNLQSDFQLPNFTRAVDGFSKKKNIHLGTRIYVDTVFRLN